MEMSKQHVEQTREAVSKPKAIYFNKTELRERGFTDAAITSLLGSPDKTRKRQGQYGTYCEHLYLVDRVKQAESHSEFHKFRERKERMAAGRANAFQKRKAAFDDRYSIWTQAIPDGCNALFSLNRYAKYDKCSTRQRDDIYDLKKSFLELLYSSGYCTACWEHLQKLPDQMCYNCDGTGQVSSLRSFSRDQDDFPEERDYDSREDLDEGDTDDGVECSRCGGTGVYRDGKTLRYLCFRFEVGGQTFVWHQPGEYIGFAVVTTEPPKEWEGLPVEKPIPLNPRKFAEAKDLLRWLLAHSTAGNLPR